MRDGFIRVGAATSNVVVANPIENARNIIEKISKASRNKVRVLTFQELALSGYTCGDLFLQEKKLLIISSFLLCKFFMYFDYN